MESDELNPFKSTNPIDQTLSQEKPDEKITEDLERVATGIPGLDEMISGGFERNSSVLVIGGAGSGKSTFSMQYLYNGITQFNEPGVYVTFEEKPEKIRKHMGLLGWDLQKLEDENKLRIIRIEPAEVINVIKENYGEIVSAITDISAKRVVIDSMTSVEFLSKDEYEEKENELKFLDWLSKNNITSIIISESEQTLDHTSKHGLLEYSVDGVIILYTVRHQNIVENALEVRKMRGTNHLRKIVPFKITETGIKVFNKAELFGQL